MMPKWPLYGDPTFETHFACWDVAFYLQLAISGYSPGSPACAFYPLWPLLVSGVISVTSLSPVLAGTVSANLLYAYACAILFEHVRSLFGSVVAGRTILALTALPGAVFFHFAYAESLFLFLLVSFATMLYNEHYGKAFVLALLLPISRPVGVFLVLPLIIHVVWLVSQNAPQKKARFVSAVGYAFVACGIALGFGAYLMLMRAFTGNAFEGFIAQEFWQTHALRKLLDLKTFIFSFFNIIEFHAYSGSLLDRVLFLANGSLLLVTGRRYKHAYGLFLALVLLPAMSGSFTSLSRFSVLHYPAALGIALLSNNDKFFFKGICAILLGTQLVILWRFVNYQWAG